MYIEVNNTDEALKESLKILFEKGQEVSPRGLKTLELHPLMIKIKNVKDPIIKNKERKPNYIFMCMEPIWIFTGDEEPWIIDYMKNLEKYADVVDGNKRLMGAYGPRIFNHFKINQLEAVINKLKNDMYSRQAFIVIPDPEIDYKGYKDVPCTQWMGFLIRDNKLDITVVMRSNDAILGFTYDSFLFCLIQNVIASILKIEPGDYYHIANSFHLYEKDFEKAKKIIDSELIESPIPNFENLRYNNLEEIKYDISFAKNLKKNKSVADNDRYFTKLLRYVLSNIK